MIAHVRAPVSVATAARRFLTMESASTGSIFLSYRRADTRHLSGRLYDRLVDRFGRARIFMDVDSM